MRSPEFYQQRLDGVSRSFALCIPQLEPPFRDQVALAYLLLRVLDTVEDAPFGDKRTQERQFASMRGFLCTMPRESDVDAFITAFPAALTRAERDLVACTIELLEDAHALPAPARAAVFDAVERMSRGMAGYARRPGPLQLLDLEDVTRYCCFVAGLVGEMLTRLWAIERVNPAPSMLLAYRFGVFLQKVNILKDQNEDEAAGRFFVPDRRELLASLRADASGALGYLQALPSHERGYRVFCGWSLMMGAATVSYLGDAKPSHRAETSALLERTASVIHDNDALAELFAELMPELPALRFRAPRVKPESHDWFRSNLAAPLSETELMWLGTGLWSSAAAI